MWILAQFVLYEVYKEKCVVHSSTPECENAKLI